MHSKEFVDEMRKKLLDSKMKFQEELSGLKPHTELGNDIGENAEEVELDEVNRDLISRLENDISKIDIALDKIDSGIYGLDVDGNNIPEDRLRVLPWADKSI